MPLKLRDLGRCAYADALALQEDLVARKLAGEGDDYVLFVEHDPVYTLGRGAAAADVCGADERLGVPVFRVSRGGGVTYHGPGQLVLYPILALPPARRDVRRYVETIEAIVIGACLEFGVCAGRRPGFPGVWVGERKLASIGIGLRRWVTFHGAALNVSTDLGYFDAIVPCRMPELRMTTLGLELGYAPPLGAVRAALERQCRAAFAFAGDAAVELVA